MSILLQKKVRLNQVSEPADNIASIFTARRDLLQVVRSTVAGSGFTVEEADLLVSLFGVRKMGWEDLPHDGQGYVAFKELEMYLVHNPSLLSRRIRKLALRQPPLVEIGMVDVKKSHLHFNSQQVRITTEGVERIAPVWEKYRDLSARILEGIPQGLLDAHFNVNDEISARIRKRRTSATDFLAH